MSHVKLGNKTPASRQPVAPQRAHVRSAAPAMRSRAPATGFTSATRDKHPRLDAAPATYVTATGQRPWAEVTDEPVKLRGLGRKASLPTFINELAERYSDGTGAWRFGDAVRRGLAATTGALPSARRPAFEAALTRLVAPTLYQFARTYAERRGQPFTDLTIEVREPERYLNPAEVERDLGVAPSRLGRSPGDTPETRRAFRVDMSNWVDSTTRPQTGSAPYLTGRAPEALHHREIDPRRQAFNRLLELRVGDPHRFDAVLAEVVRSPVGLLAAIATDDPRVPRLPEEVGLRVLPADGVKRAVLQGLGAFGAGIGGLGKRENLPEGLALYDLALAADANP